MLTLALVWLTGPLFGQPGNQIFSAGYGLPLLAPVAPGQVVTLFIRGLKAGPASASTLPLPTTLAGVSVSLKQAGGFSGPAPIFRILPLDPAGLGCDGGRPVPCGLSAVTVQIPFEIRACGLDFSPCVSLTATAVENGVAGEQLNLSTAPSRFHILNSCDATQVLAGCQLMILRPDGSLSQGFASPGEVLTVFAVGLGPTMPPVLSGTASPSPPARAALPVSVLLDFKPNAFTLPGRILREPRFVGLSPGSVGLYQLNIEMPDQIPPEARRCDSPSPFGTNMTLTVSVGGVTESVEICVGQG